MDILQQKYIIIEIIPTTSTKETGDIIQISALKINGLKLLERFDYRLKKDKIKNPAFLELISYDTENFTYVDTTEDLLQTLDKWSENLPLLILNNSYTNSYLKDLSNEKMDICALFQMEYSDDFITKLIQKYNLEESNYIVDLLYESIIKLH